MKTGKQIAIETHEWVAWQRKKAVVARNKSTNVHRKVMLGGKVKAYTEVLNLIEARYGEVIYQP